MPDENKSSQFFKELDNTLPFSEQQAAQRLGRHSQKATNRPKLPKVFRKGEHLERPFDENQPLPFAKTSASARETQPLDPKDYGRLRNEAPRSLYLANVRPRVDMGKTCEESKPTGDYSVVNTICAKSSKVLLSLVLDQHADPHLRCIRFLASP
jgi:hypothetical protein